MRWATFDCYGTLVDWNAGISAALGRLWPAAVPDRLLRRYHELEPQVQRESPNLSYRDVLSLTLSRVAEREGLPLSAEAAPALADSLPGWRPFPDAGGSLAELQRRGFRLAVLSNIDQDLIEPSIASLGVAFDVVVTAADAGSYKPAPGHWRTFFERTGAAADEHVHVAQSLFHDIAPALELGLSAVWINRLGEAPRLRPPHELPDLERLPDVLDELVLPA